MRDAADVARRHHRRRRRDRHAEAVTTVTGRHAGLRHRPGAVRRLQLDREEGAGHRAARSVDLADAGRDGASANLSNAEANLERQKVALADAQQKLRSRAKELARSSCSTESTSRTAEVNVQVRREAQLKSTESAIVQAEAAVNKARSGPRSHGHHRAHRRHRHQAQRRQGADGQRRHVGAGALHHRGGPDEDAGQREHRRGRRGPHAPGPGRARSASTPIRTSTFRGAVKQVRLQADDGAERRHLLDRHRRAESAS